MSELSEKRVSRIEADYGVSEENQELLIRLLKSEQAVLGNKLPRELFWIRALLAEKPYREVEPWTLADRMGVIEEYACTASHLAGTWVHHAAWKITYRHLPKWSAAEWNFKKQDAFYKVLYNAFFRWQDHYHTVLQKPLRQPKKVRNPCMTPVANLRGTERLQLRKQSLVGAGTAKRVYDAVKPLFRKLADNVRQYLPLVEAGGVLHCSGGSVGVMVYSNFRIAGTEVIVAAVTISKHPDGFLVSADISDEDTGHVYHKEAPVLLPGAFTDESIDVITSLARKLSERAETIVGVLKKGM